MKNKNKQTKSHSVFRSTVLLFCALILVVLGTYFISRSKEKPETEQRSSFEEMESAVMTAAFPMETAAETMSAENPRKTETTMPTDETQEESSIEVLVPAEITAGTILTEAQVEQAGADAFFTVEEISDEVFARMWLKSFKEDCTTPREELRYIRCLHKDIDGNIKVGELVMHEMVAETVCGIFKELYELSYPFESMRLVDDFDADDETSIMANNTSAFNFRFVDSTTEISRHAYGLAIDINPYYNVYYIPSEGYIFPEDGWQYLDREADFPYKLTPEDDCYRLFTEAGFQWGGWWTYNTDYQHFQYVY